MTLKEKNIVPNNGIIIYENIPCIIINYYQDEVSYANVIYKNTQIILEYDNYGEHYNKKYKQWSVIDNDGSVTWEDVIKQLIMHNNNVIYNMIENIKSYNFEIKNLNFLLKKTKTLEEISEFSTQKIHTRISQLKKMILDNEKNIEKYKNKIKDLKLNEIQRYQKYYTK